MLYQTPFLMCWAWPNPAPLTQYCFLSASVWPLFLIYDPQGSLGPAPRGRFRRVHPSPSGPWNSLCKANLLFPQQLGNRSNYPDFDNSRAKEACWPLQNRESRSRHPQWTKEGQKLSQDTCRADLSHRRCGGEQILTGNGG